MSAGSIKEAADCQLRYLTVYWQDVKRVGTKEEYNRVIRVSSKNTVLKCSNNAAITMQ